LDVSKQAAKELGFIRSGLAKVQITVLQFGDA
jgi:rare lipoprotein A (peptidoglycan hydrolase)